jgi:hypothetical protein
LKPDASVPLPESPDADAEGLPLDELLPVPPAGNGAPLAEGAGASVDAGVPPVDVAAGVPVPVSVPEPDVPGEVLTVEAVGAGVAPVAVFAGVVVEEDAKVESPPPPPHAAMNSERRRVAALFAWADMDIILKQCVMTP